MKRILFIGLLFVCCAGAKVRTPVRSQLSKADAGKHDAGTFGTWLNPNPADPNQ